MSSIYDLYLKNNIIAECTKHFKEYLKEQDAENEDLGPEDLEGISLQIDVIIKLIVDIYREYDEEADALAAIVDKLIGICILGKMNEARLCKILNERKE
jgi:hypothetical protein